MLVAENLVFRRSASKIILDGVNVTLVDAESVAVVGVSGSGKTTLLQCLAGLAKPNSGRVVADTVDLYATTETRRRAIRLKSFGFVFQFGELIPELTLVENVELPLRFAGLSRAGARSKALEAMDDVGIVELADRRIGDVSGGEQQRAAIARAVAHAPSVIFADEPTGSLDEETSEAVISSLLSTARSRGATVILASHDPAVAQRADRVLQVVNGGLTAVGAST